MPKKSRAERKLAKNAQRAVKSIRLKEAFIDENLDSTPKIAVIPDIHKVPQTDLSIGDLEIPKQPKSFHNGSRFGFCMSWCARSSDCEGEWSWGEQRQWNDSEWTDDILMSMNHLEGLDWKEIQSMSSDTGHLMHHDHDILDLCDDAVQRWVELELDQFETVFRFRLGNKKRAWGIEKGGHFYLIWWERNHRIYPV